MQPKPNIDESWYKVLQETFESSDFDKLRSFLQEEKAKYRVYPPGNKIFNAFNLTPLPAVKVVLLGQDPYHGPGQAHGLAFSVPEGIKPPPSLVNIFKEVRNDLGFSPPISGNLEKWAREGVLLLNTCLTVREASPTSHAGKGWELFTDSAIRAVSEQRAGVVFLLWGKHAQAKESLIDTSKHFILKTVHPSPLSASRGFLGCKHFSKANQYLIDNGLLPVDWNLNEA
jgi:uracil-DNA glycosylase